MELRACMPGTRRIAYLHAAVTLTGTIPPSTRQAMAAPAALRTEEEFEEVKKKVEAAEKDVDEAKKKVEEAKKTLKQLEGGRSKEE